jgi:hypothetical protein
MNTPSLRDRIRNASSTQEVYALLEEGKNYRHASGNTREKWTVAAAVRIAALGVLKR